MAGSFAEAHQEAERRKAEAEARHRAELEAIAREEWSAHIYDPLPYPEAVPDPRMFDGTGVGLLYGSRASAHLEPLLGDWRVIPGSKRP